MTLRQLIYRLYLKSPGWLMTKQLRKANKCKRCKWTHPLELHHVSYRWHNRHPLLRWIVPNLWDPMQTLCAYHHELAHKKGKK